MCDPLTITGLALTAGSTVANNVAAGQAASARSSALQAERVRQGALDQEADALNAVSQDRYKNFEGQQDEKRQELGDYFASQQAAAPAAAEAVPTAASSNITVQEEAKQRGKARQDADASAANLASLRSFGDLLGGISRQQARDAGQIGQIGGFKRGWANNVLPYEMEAASQKGAGLRTLGDIMGGVGSLATMAGLSGKTFGNLFSGFAPLNATGLPTATARAGTVAAAPAAGTVRLGSLY